MAHHGGEHEWDLTHAQVKDAYYVRRQYSLPFPIPCAPSGPCAQGISGKKASKARSD